MWHGPRDFNCFSSNAPPVLDIARDMAAAVPQWSSADMDFLSEVNNDAFKNTSTQEYQIQPSNFTNMVSDNYLFTSENIVDNIKQIDNTGIEYSCSGEESVFISRKELVNSDSGLCVKTVHKTTYPSNGELQSNPGNLWHDSYVPTYNLNQIQYFQPCPNFNMHSQYGYIQNPPVLQNPTALYYQHTGVNFVDNNVNYQYDMPALPCPQNILYGSTLPDYSTVHEAEQYSGDDGNDCPTQNIINANPEDVDEKKTYYVGDQLKANGENEIDVNQCENRSYTCRETHAVVDIKPDDKVTDKTELQGQITQEEITAVGETCKKDTNFGCQNAQAKSSDFNIRPSTSRNNKPVEVGFTCTPCPFPSGVQNVSVDKFGHYMTNSQSNQFNHVLAPFNPSIPPPPIFPSMSQQVPQKMLLYDQSKPAASFRNVAEATTPSGHKFYIPLDDSRYELKKSRHDLYDIPRGCNLHRLESEGEFESSVQLGFSPRPVQFKGSLSEDDDDSSDESSSSDTSQTTRMSSIPSTSEDRLVKKQESFPDKSISSRKKEEANTKVSVEDNLNETTENENPDFVDESMNIDTVENNYSGETHFKAQVDEETIQTENGLYQEAKVNQNTCTETTSNTTAPCIGTGECAVDRMAECATENGDDNKSDCTPESGNGEKLQDTYLADVKITANTIVQVDETSQNSEQIIQSNVDHSYLLYTQPEFVSSGEQNPALLTPAEQDQQLWYQSPMSMEYVNSQQFMAPQIYDQSRVAYGHEYPVFMDINQEYNQDIPVPYYSGNNINQDGTNMSAYTGESQRSIPQELFNPDDGLPYPALHISNDGLITVILRHGVYVEMTTEKAVRVVNHDKKLVAAFSDTGNKSCVIHPAARIYQSDSSVDAELSLNRKAKMTSSNIVFGNTFKTYKFDYTTINEVPNFNDFRCLNEDLSINFLDTNTGFFNSDVLLRCSELITRAYFEKQGDTGSKVIINGTKIVQNVNGDVMVYSGSIRYIRMSPTTNVIRLRTQFMELDIETNWNLKLHRGTQTLNSSHLGFILSNGKIKASIDQRNRMDAFSLPYYRRLCLNQPVPHSRPGVAPRRRYIHYNRRFEPEFDHRAYTRY